MGTKSNTNTCMYTHGMHMYLCLSSSHTGGHLTSSWNILEWRAQFSTSGVRWWRFEGKNATKYAASPNRDPLQGLVRLCFEKATHQGAKVNAQVYPLGRKHAEVNNDSLLWTHVVLVYMCSLHYTRYENVWKCMFSTELQKNACELTCPVITPDSGTLAFRGVTAISLWEVDICILLRLPLLSITPRSMATRAPSGTMNWSTRYGCTRPTVVEMFNVDGLPHTDTNNNYVHLFWEKSLYSSALTLYKPHRGDRHTRGLVSLG